MNILELAGFCSNYGSNFIPTLQNLDEKLTSEGHKVFYIFSNENLSKGFYEWELPFSQKHNTTLANFHSIKFLKFVSRYIKDNHIDIVHAHFCSSIYLSIVKKLSPSNVSFFQHIHTMPYNNHIGSQAKIKRFRNTMCFDEDITIICISKSMVPIVQYLYPKNKVLVCINCIDFSRLTYSKCNRNLNFKILLFGYNYFVKGVDIAIKSVIKAREYINDIHLDIIMGDNMEENTNRIIKEFGEIPKCVSILEPTNNISPFYKDHTVFLNASRSEGGSYAILEAYYSGSLCVISDVPATKESELPNVIMFESENIDSLSCALIEAYKVKDTYCNNPEYVLNKFSIDSWCNNIVSILGLQ